MWNNRIFSCISDTCTYIFNIYTYIYTHTHAHESTQTLLSFTISATKILIATHARWYPYDENQRDKNSGGHCSA